MPTYQQAAANLLDNTGAHNPERAIQKAHVYAYMARTEALKPEPEVVRPDKVWLISMRENKDDSLGEWSVIEAHTNQWRATERWRAFSNANHPKGVELKMEAIDVLS